MERDARRPSTPGGLVLAAAFAVILARTVPEVPGVLIAYGRYTATRTGQDDIIYKDVKVQNE